ncbi:hypothetical protein BGZ83_000423 [Gryganskiella cystojenkinii]|nr:hypothetical protein BGZ83_000423 [Gryganskiella cystojenkinii]
MARTLFFSVPTLVQDELEDAELGYSESIPMNESVHRLQYETESEDDEDEISDDCRSPLSSLFLDRQLQTEAPLTPAAIYLDVPPHINSSRPKSVGGLLGQSLLDPQTSVTGTTTVSYKRLYNDPFFAARYLTALTVYFVLGIVLFFATDSSPLDGQIYNIYLAMKSSAGPDAGASGALVCSARLCMGVDTSVVRKGLAAYIFAAHTLRSSDGAFTGVASTGISFFITRIFTHIMTIT